MREPLRVESGENRADFFEMDDMVRIAIHNKDLGMLAVVIPLADLVEWVQGANADPNQQRLF